MKISETTLTKPPVWGIVIAVVIWYYHYTISPTKKQRKKDLFQQKIKKECDLI